MDNGMPANSEAQQKQWWHSKSAYLKLAAIAIVLFAFFWWMTRPNVVMLNDSSSVTGSQPAPESAKEINGIKFLHIPAGLFQMGSSEMADEAPIHQVNLDEFWIMETEVTNAQFDQFVAADGYGDQAFWSKAGWEWNRANRIVQPECNVGFDRTEYNGATFPIICISWYEAVAFANWFSQISGENVRLPTEAEWEKAARGVDGRKYPWGNEEPNIDTARHFWSKGSGPVAITSHPEDRSPYGVYDMAGNVTEWTSSKYISYPYENLGSEDLSSAPDRVSRGGNWDFDETYMRTTFRRVQDQTKGSGTIGMRLVLAPISSD